MVRGHVVQGEKCLTSQRHILGKLSMAGTDTTQAEELLVVFEKTQRLHVEDLDRLLLALSEVTK